MTHQNYKRSIFILICMLAVLCVFPGCAKKADSPVTSLSQLGDKGRKIGVGSGMLEFDTLKLDYPNAEVIAYTDNQLAYEDVANGRIDAYVYARREMEFAIANGTTGVRLLEEDYSKNTIAVGISPKAALQDIQSRLNAFLAELKSDGTLDDMYSRWVIQADDAMPDIAMPKNPTSTLRVGTTGTVMPYSYFVGTELRGYDIELAYRFAAWLGANVEFKIYDFGGIISAAASGDVDCVMSNIFVTPENSETIPFSDPLFDVGITAMVKDEDGEITLDSLNGKRFGVQSGTVFDAVTLERLPDVEISLYNTISDMVLAMKSGKIDAFTADDVVLRPCVAKDESLLIVPELITHADTAFAFPKTDEGKTLHDEFNAFLATLIQTGELEEIKSLWFNADDSIKSAPPLESLSGENGTLTMATISIYPPMEYYIDGEIAGYEIDLAYRFCKARGYGLILKDMAFDSVLISIQSGKCDFAAASINITEERSESVDFSDPVYVGGVAVCVLKPSDGGYQSVDELEGKRIGVITGSIHDGLISKRLSDVELVYFAELSDLPVALEAGKIDAFTCPESTAMLMRNEHEGLRWLDEHLVDAPLGFAFAKTEEGRELNRRFSEFILASKENGVIEELRRKWFGKDESVKTMDDYNTLPDTNGTLTLATAGTQVPFTYVKDNMIVGYEIELAALFCAENGYGLHIEQMNFDGLIAAVQTGKCDIACSCLAMTEERKESVDFSESHYKESVVIVVSNEKPAETEKGFFASVGESFEKTFIRENRWQLFLQGVGTTMLITVLSIVFGTILGFAVFMLCRNGNPVARSITWFFVWLVQGMPVVVLLMILYYIIFGKVAISGAAVSVVGFTLVFGSAVYAMMRSGVGAIDNGQLEAAYALGYTNRRAFFRIILPQALPHFMPAYKGEITALIKATAVVGYVAVQDLTKMGDIVRSRTYEAFFPLIAVAVIYFVLAAILTFIVKRIEFNSDPRRRSKKQIMKGVKTDD